MKKRFRLFLQFSVFAFLSLFFVIEASAQSKQVSGQIKDSFGESLPGVSVVVQGTTNGTISDIEGKYTLNVDAKDVLVYSFIGMKSQSINVGDQVTINVTLLDDAIGLDEVVAIGYGTMKRSDLSGASTTIKADDYKDMPATDIAQSIQGRVAGVSISQTSGSPGATTKIRIRGGNSMLGSNNPLIVLDGVAMNIDIGDLNPNDIESMEILKDASSTAIYGSRGANGVIVITTNKGQSEKMRVQISSNYSFDQVANKYDLLEAAPYAELINAMNSSDVFSPSEIENYRRNGGTDWQDEIFQQGYTSNNQVSLSGGSKKVKYFMSGSYLDQNGLLINTGQKRYSLRSNVDAQVSDRFQASFNVSITKSEKNNNDDMAGSKGSPIWNSLIWSPTEPVYKEDGSYNMNDQYGSIGLNPYMVSMERKRDVFETITMANATFKYELTNKLQWSAIFGVENNDIENAEFINRYVRTTTGSSRSYGNSLFAQASTFLTYNNTFNKVHRLTAMGGYEQSSRTFKSFSANGSNLLSESVGYHNLALNASQGIASNYERWALRSFLGRVAYAYNDRYLLTATYRMDGSSRFRDDNKFSGFPSAAIGWRLSEEGFIKDMDMFQNLKLRASWGITGNQAIRPYGTMALLSPFTYSYGTPTGYTGYSPVGAENPALKWEETTQLNFGLDFSMFNGRLNSTIDVFKKNTDGLLQAKALPSYNGGGTVIQNIGEIENKGFEFMAAYDIIRKSDLKWNAAFNISSVKNNVVSIGDEDQIFPGSSYGGGFLDSKIFVVKPGESLGSFYGYNFVGIWQAHETAEAAKFGYMPGDSKYEDLNGDNVIDGQDLQVIGNAMPDFSWGLNNQISYKNFDFNVMIEGVHGRDVLNLGYAAAGVAVGDARSITLAEAANAWTETNTNTIWPKLNSSTNVDHINSSKWLQDGSYIRLRNISVSYRLPKDLVKIGDLKLSVSAQNLLTITDYKGFDPEVTSTGGSDIDQGLDLGSYPSARSYTLGITLNF
ncbi:SusC/RagA family TonB-linked outer membrane protein [Carboxylicivirga sp. N1Y90]|uniref:SusC/RagA family TonB-linked outer membrane protein n=1 Tax=Carboxylicivirga fragile TaxID=3417571 RepID=UPI003D34CBC0|nr:TonB-dependent receptor [Marinilabiliaceae bacterium N1Y90]